MYEWTTRRRGSISAEHGLGRMKAEAIGYSKPHEAVSVMADIKALLDPSGILNPYKVMRRSVCTHCVRACFLDSPSKLCD